MCRISNVQNETQLRGMQTPAAVNMKNKSCKLDMYYVQRNRTRDQLQKVTVVNKITELSTRLTIDICTAEAPPVLAAAIGEVWLVEDLTVAD